MHLRPEKPQNININSQGLFTFPHLFFLFLHLLTIVSKCCPHGMSLLYQIRFGISQDGQDPECLRHYNIEISKSQLGKPSLLSHPVQLIVFPTNYYRDLNTYVHHTLLFVWLCFHVHYPLFQLLNTPSKFCLQSLLFLLKGHSIQIVQ